MRLLTPIDTSSAAVDVRSKEVTRDVKRRDGVLLHKETAYPDEFRIGHETDPEAHPLMLEVTTVVSGGKVCVSRHLTRTRLFRTSSARAGSSRDLGVKQHSGTYTVDTRSFASTAQHREWRYFFRGDRAAP